MLKSKKFKIAALVVGAFILALVSFAGGMAIGFRKAKFSYKFGENYERNFTGHGPSGMMDGRGSCFAARMAPSTASTSFPSSTLVTCH